MCLFLTGSVIVIFRYFKFDMSDNVQVPLNREVVGRRAKAHKPQRKTGVMRRTTSCKL